MEPPCGKRRGSREGDKAGKPKRVGTAGVAGPAIDEDSTRTARSYRAGTRWLLMFCWSSFDFRLSSPNTEESRGGLLHGQWKVFQADGKRRKGAGEESNRLGMPEDGFANHSRNLRDGRLRDYSSNTEKKR